MKNITNIKAFDKIYPALFSVVTLILLISFISSSEISLSSISTGFRWRSNLIDIYTSFRLKTGDHVFNNAVIGKDGWIFYTGEMSIQDYQNTEPMRKKKLIFLQQELSLLSADLEKKGITLLVVIPPNKSTVYSRYMPEEIPVIGETPRLDQFIEFMNLYGGVSIVDLRQTLRSASLSQDVYFKTDTHWNDMGAYYGYVEIMHALSSDYPVLKPRSLSDFEYKKAGDSIRDIPLLMGLLDYKETGWALIPKFEVELKETSVVLPDGTRRIRTVTNIDKQLPELLVFGDSFYGRLAHFVEPHFSRVVTVPFTGAEGIWSLDWIQRENPDIVIIEVVERYIDVTLPMLFGN